MPVSHGLFGFNEAEVRAELDRRQARHTRRLRAAQERLQKLRSANAARADELLQLQAELDRATAERDSLLAQAVAADEQRGDLLSALAAQYREEAARQHQALNALKERLQQYRSLRALLTAGVVALIYPFLRERSRKEEARNV